MNNVGVFVCTGCEIGAAVPLENLEKVASEAGVAIFTAHENLCSPEGVAVIRSAVDDGTVDGVVIAACSHRAKTEEFRFDPTSVHVERVCLREQVAWSQPHGEMDTCLLAEDLLRMGVVRTGIATAPARLGQTVDRTVMVVGGGLAGLKAAQAAAGMGNPVLLVESADRLGGYVAGLKDLVPEVPPYDTIHANGIAALVAAVEADPDIRIRTSSRTQRIDGQPGQFEVELVGPGGSEVLQVGAIVQATGARPYDTAKLAHLGYGASANVVTTQDLERMLAAGDLKCPAGGGAPRRVVFVQCAGSRDPEHLPYCSSECCAASLKQVAAIHRDHPGVETAVVYRDLRAPGQLEHFYRGVQELPDSLFVRGEVAGVEKTPDDRLTVFITESLLGDDVSLDADLVVLATGMVPVAADGEALATGMVPVAADGEAIRELRDARGRIERNESDSQVKAAQEVVAKLEAHDGTQILNLGYRQGPDLPVLSYNFNDSHFICFPYETRLRDAPHRHLRRRRHAGPHGPGAGGRGRARRGHEGRAVPGDGVPRRSGPPASGRHLGAGVLPAALHAMQALYGGVPVRCDQRGRERHAGIQPAPLPALRHLPRLLPGAHHQFPRLLGGWRRRHDQVHRCARRGGREAAGHRLHVRERRAARPGRGRQARVQVPAVDPGHPGPLPGRGEHRLDRRRPVQRHRRHPAHGLQEG